MDIKRLKYALLCAALLIAALLLMWVFGFPAKDIAFNVACSLVSSAVIICLTKLLLEPKHDNCADLWHLADIFETRAEINRQCEQELQTAKKCVDIIAFGLHTFRNKNGDAVRKLLAAGVNIRILTMNPDNNPYILARAKEEGQIENAIRTEIKQLVEWADNLNRLSVPGKVTVKGYNCMTLHFYWRMDDIIYLGPYWYGKDSQVTPTFKFLNGNERFKIFTDYFEELWQDKNGDNIIVLTKPK